MSAELKKYLDGMKSIRPLSATFKDSSFLYGSVALASCVLMIGSGLNDKLDVITQSDTNYFRASQGTIATLNMALTTALIFFGRLQTYRDLADFQKGIDPDEILKRADKTGKGKLSLAFDWAVANVHNNTAAISVALCCLMMASGITSGRPGEAITAGLLIPTYLMRLLPEKYGASVKKVDEPKVGVLKEVFMKIKSMSPLAMSSFFQAWRLFPAFVNAAWEKDPYQSSQYALAFIMLMFLSNTTKDGIGRYKGSILKDENALAITKAMLEGRFLKIGSMASKPVPEKLENTPT